MAEIFGVTSDELLRGCRSAPSPIMKIDLSQIRSTFQVRTLWAALPALIGVILGLIIAYALEKGNPTLGYLIIAAMCLVSGVLQTTFTLQALERASAATARGNAPTGLHDEILHTMVHGYIVLFSLMAGMLPLMVDWYAQNSLKRLCFLFLVITLPLSGILLRVKWFIIEPIMSTSGKYFQSTHKSPQIRKLRNSILGWEIFVIATMLVFSLTSYAMNFDMQALISAGILVVTLPVDTVIYAVRKAKMKK